MRNYDEEWTNEDLEDTVQQLHPDLSTSERQELIYGESDEEYIE